ncbi:hypothetical protein C8Q73DRAFT_311218 [Cubamyces lactineus]|nr:hypothetical protein C8Q73DRAFT_311218 [Cubamyces lactineus]
MQIHSILALFLLVAKVLCDETQSGMPTQTNSMTAIDPTPPCINSDCLRPTPAWVSHPTTIEIISTASPVGLLHGNTHVKIVGAQTSTKSITFGLSSNLLERQQI